MKNIVFYLLAATLFFSCSGKKAAPVEAKADAAKLYSWQFDDAAMNAAATQARASLDSFATALQGKTPGLANFALKIRFAGLGGAEDVWVINIKTTPTGFWGTVNNKPQKTVKVKEGNPVKFTRQNITDWMYTENGTLHGGYTIRLMQSRMTAKERAKLDTSVAFKLR